MNKYDNFFKNLFPLRPFMPYVQCVLPTVFDDSLSYLETLGKVVKALNNTESNVNTLEQAVRAFADDLALYGNLTISPVEITFNQETGRYYASMTYADIVSAINEGHTMVLHVMDGLHGVVYYTATIKVAEINGVNLLYWESPAYTVNDVTVFYEAFINEYDSAGVSTRTITGSGGGVDTFVIHYDSDTETADKTFAEIVAAIEAEKAVALIADRHYIGSAQWTTTSNDQQGYEIISVSFTAGSVISAQTGYNWASVTYAVDNSDAWSVDRHGFPDATRVNALIDARIAALDGFNSIKKLIYNESTGNVVYYDGERSTPVTGEYVVLNFLSDPKIYVVLEGGVTTSGDTVYNLYEPFRYGYVNGADIGVQFYRVFNGNIEVVTLPPNSSVATKTTTPIGGEAAPYRIPVTVDAGVYSTTATGNDILLNVHNCYAQVGNVTYYPVGAVLSGPYGTVYLAAIDPHTHGTHEADILQFTLNGSDVVTTVDHYTNDITTGEMQKILIAASSQSIPSLFPNRLYVFTGDATALNITLIAPRNNNIVNEYHFIFKSGATPTALTLPNTVNKPEGFTIEANHVYEVSILENNMTAQSWAVTV